MIATGGLGAGSTRLHDPLLESLHLSWLRFGHGLVLSSVLLWVGVAVMLIAWLVIRVPRAAGSGSRVNVAVDRQKETGVLREGNVAP